MKSHRQIILSSKKKENLRESQKLKAQGLVTMKVYCKNANEDDETTIPTSFNREG